ncbi:MAG: MFS transporter [Candidatus Thorarchaeota archaeon]
MTLEKKASIQSSLKEITLLLLSTLTVMAGSTISPAINDMAQFFSSMTNAAFLARLSLTIPALSFAIIAPIIGIIIDRIGRKPVLISSLFLYIIAGTSGFYLKSLYAILVGRIFLGIAVAGVMNATLTLIADYYSGAKRDRVIGFQIAFGAFGGVVFLLVGGALADIDWYFPFLVYLIPIILIPLAIFILHEPKKEQKIELMDENQALENSSNNSESSEEKNITNGSSDFGRSTKIIIAISYLLIFIVMVVFYTGPTQLSFYIPTIDPSVNNFLIGLAMSLVNLTAGIMGLLYRPIKKMLDFQIIFIIGFSLFGAGFLLLFLAKNYAVILVAATIGGIGFGMIMPNLSLYLVSNTKKESRGIIFSGYNAMLYLGQFFSPIIFQPIIVASDIATVFLIGSIIYFSTMLIPIILLVQTIIRKRKSQNDSQIYKSQTE